MKKPIKVGLDFDGVVAYNPFRLIRAPISYFKRNILGIKKLSFYYPTTYFQQLIWRILHESSIYPARGIDLLHQLVKEKQIEAHLITARYSFLDTHLSTWIQKHKLENLFSSININHQNMQPHLFKEQMVMKHKLDIFIEDNLDIVCYLHKRSGAKIYWIYNLLDRRFNHPYKFPYLEKALNEIMESQKLKVKSQRSKIQVKS